MSILFKRCLFQWSILTLSFFLVSSKLFSMQKEEQGIINLSENNNKENILTEVKKNDFLNRIKMIPIEALEKKKDAKLPVDFRDREDKFWINEKGDKVLIESK